MIKVFKNEDFNNVNAYLLVNDTTMKCILIDTTGKSQQIIDYINENNLVLTDVFITHFHIDHTFGLDLIQKEFSPIIHIGEKDFPFLFEPKYNGENRLNKKNNLIKDNNFLLINENATLWINNFDIKIILFGGHTPGTCFYIVNNEYAFIGDTIFKNNIGFKSDKIDFCDDEQFYKSLDYVMENFKSYVLCPGHGDTMFKMGEVEINPDHPYNKWKSEKAL